MNKTDAIKVFLERSTHPDLALMYNHDMECQVNVAQDGGERIQGEYKGKRWSGWTDNTSQIWKPFRIPYNAGSDPHYVDKVIRFDLQSHVEGIGMTGWNWKSKTSSWIAFDFDAIIGHSDRHPTKLTVEQLKAVQEAACSLPWVTVRNSTSGKGLHIYVRLENVPTKNHSEHAALARAVLHLMSLKTGFAFDSHVDICGGNMWVWHRKMKGTNGLDIIKEGITLQTIPPNWRDHVNVVTGKRRRILPDFASTEFDELISQKQHAPLDEIHKALVQYLDQSGASFWWDQDHYMLVAHTHDLLMAHQELGFKGLFTTVATGSMKPDHNCFMYPQRNGAWSVRRFSEGTTESNTWEQDGKGWTRCYLNREPDLKTVAKANSGVEHPTGGFVFRLAGDAQDAATQLNVDLELPNKFLNRETKLKQHKDGRLVAEVRRESHDDGGEMRGWISDKGNKWTRIYDLRTSEPDEVDVSDYDDLIRHVISPGGGSMGWMIHSEKQWSEEPLAHVNVAMRSIGLKAGEVQTIVGNNIFKPWLLVNRPFENEYLGDRTWNRDAAQFRYAPNLDKDEFHCPTWSKLLDHIGIDLDNHIQTDPWCKDSGLATGADYLRCWIASLFQAPYEPLPYLFLWGPQNSGKSILHEAVDLLMTKGYVRADKALKLDFNGELKSAVLCVVEETDMKQDKQAYNAIKDYVTSLQISLHIKGLTPVMVPNTTHWIQCSNELTSVPIFDGDSRITVIHVGDLKNSVPKPELLGKLRKEAPDFLASVLKLELPKSNDRLNIPVLESEGKAQVIDRTHNLLQEFIAEHCFRIPGNMIRLADFHTKFQKWLEPSERYTWTKHKISKEMPSDIPKGRSRVDSTWCWGNLAFESDAPYGIPYIRRDDKLYQVEVSDE